MSEIARKAAEKWCYDVYAWRGRSPAFMQSQVRQLADIIRSAIEEATKDLQHDCKRLAEALAEVTKIKQSADTKRLETWIKQIRDYAANNPNPQPYRIIEFCDAAMKQEGE